MKSPSVPNAETAPLKESVGPVKVSARRCIWLLLPVGVISAAIVGLHVAARPEPTTHHVTQAIVAGQVPVRGVNLGGWLVAEQWMNPKADIWKNLTGVKATWTEIDAAAAYAAAGPSIKSHQAAVFEAHRSTWITEEDIKAIAAANFNTIRIPVGYWIGGADTNADTKSSLWSTFAPGSLKYLDKAVNEWGPTYNLSVLVDIYGTMNGSTWPDPGDTKVPIATYNTTFNTTSFLAARYHDKPAFLGIGLLSTPDDTAHFRSLLFYYMDGYRVVRKTSPSMIVTTCPSKSFQYPGNPSAVMSEDRTFMNFLIDPDLPDTIKHAWMEWQLHPGSDAAFGNGSLDAGVANWTSRFSTWKSHEPLFLGSWNINSGATSSGVVSVAQKQEAATKIGAIANLAPKGWVYNNWKADDSVRGWGWSLQNVLKDGVKLP
ncbi:glucan 1,3-beta-glucosidase [Achlya hypogyna]|uniref:glucan 1,3-beta-glucosidase n=1 Tax=Achlya hypogyna TaxID=1202772 RepID=A0A1V9YQM2_ACHHY|nr:glucan 1,3-beta-glucosidase [Achlya hypogyna]